MQTGWTPLQYFLQFLPGYAKTPIGGIIIFDFIVRKFIKVSRIRLVISMIVSVVSGWELTIAS